jgi:5-enolpyruvylshikimate-3-phosphate synthase
MAASVTSQLRAALSGTVLAPGDAGYDTARALFNAMIDTRPAAIAQVRDTTDVAAALRIAREAG